MGPSGPAYFFVNGSNQPPTQAKETMKAADIDTVSKLIRPAVDGQGYELVDLVFRRELSGNVLRLFIDRLPGQGFVSHEDCTKVSREVSALLDVHDVLPGAYNLEVSSPGVERPLKNSEHFQRFCGQRAKVRLRMDAKQTWKGLPPPKGDAAPQRNFVGAIESVVESGTGAVVKFKDDTAGEVTLFVSEIEKANLIYPY